MNIEDNVRDAIVAELERQSQARPERLKVTRGGQTSLRIEGEANLDELVMAVVGALAGGP